MMLVELGINVVVVGLLVTTISYCWVLNKRIRILQDSRSDMAEMLKHFDESTRRAEGSIAQLQGASRKIAETIENRLEKANLMADDLTFLMERASRLADRLENATTSKPKPAPVAVPAPVQTLSKPEPEDDITQAKRAIERAKAAVDGGVPIVPQEQRLEAIAGKPQPRLTKPQAVGTEAPTAKPVSARKGNATIQEMLEKLAARTSDPALRSKRAPGPPAAAAGRARSRVEQELLELIKSGTKI